MDDFIRRKDALDLLNEQINQCNKALGYLNVVPSKTDEYAVKVERASLIAYKEQLESIPSAQSEIIRCKDCKYSQGDVFDRGLFCTHSPTWFDVNDNHYCSWRERKTNIYG